MPDPSLEHFLAVVKERDQLAAECERLRRGHKAWEQMLGFVNKLANHRDEPNPVVEVAMDYADECVRLRALVESLTARCHAQSEALAMRAEKRGDA